MLPTPGAPRNNSAIRAAALSNLRQNYLGRNTDPSQSAAQAGPGPAGPPVGGMQVGQLLAQVLRLYIQGGGRPEDTEQIRQFLLAFVQLYKQGQAGETPGVAQGQTASAPGPPPVVPAA